MSSGGGSKLKHESEQFADHLVMEEVLEKQEELDRVLEHKFKNNYSNYVQAVHADIHTIAEAHKDTYPLFALRMSLWKFYG